MSLDKAIQHGKEKRKPYRGSRSFDSSCRNHGGCPYCEGGHQYNKKKTRLAQECEICEWNGKRVRR